MTLQMARIPRCLGTLLHKYPTRHQEILSAAMSTNRFWEPDKKAGYKTKIKRPSNEMVKEGLSRLGGELGKFKKEAHDVFRMDPILDLQPGDYETCWKFDNHDVIKDWTITTDSDHNEGKSKAEFIMGKNKTALFQGVINTDLPKDGVTKKAGYANIKSPRNKKSFDRYVPYDWSVFTHLTMRVRGDGRTYMIVLHMDRYYDIQWCDQYNYMLYTRGGPYWQDVKIPFSKFYLAGKGRIQDKQETIMTQLDKVSFVGLTVGDDNPGPFNLEIDYIGVVYDAMHQEKFAYELYECSPSVHS